MPKLYCIIPVILLLLASGRIMAQSTLSGTVASTEDSLPVAGVSILNKQTGRSVVGDEHGNFSIAAQRGDTILLKILGYTPLLYLTKKEKTDVRLFLKPQPLELNPVTVLHYGYLKDSARFREEFRKSFDFRRPRWNEVVPMIGLGFAVNINALYRALSFNSNRKKDHFKKILLSKEKENYIERIFTPEVVNQLTGLEGDSLSQFMLRYEPTYEFVRNATTYDLYEYIKHRYARYASGADTTATK
ncbi:MAG TPA: carboxypeptidase-like regulatory domain-containing protein [Chitinophaga sp.]|uniref:carboxypeptidase-like regulatory domain-containing protein n=1 Tax=Chitinophaga sp. TaxID=1869181 RepID=UPI002CC66790|nr:carboxypeptidase-like regulatory domain-containing protein [Chitinophaga sp.]HVI48376.1 carboxypeptidase-like regulatory domain-containing protein [Chitinophaga sp.]